MTITTSITETFSNELAKAIHDFSTDTFKIALIKGGESGTFDRETTNYSDLGADEASGTGYTAGGQTITPTIIKGANYTYIDFNDVTWSGTTISASGCIIYNSSKSNSAIYVGSFGGIITTANGSFSVVMPNGDESNALIRIVV